ncbi:MAG: anthranilate synthase component I [Deltaproteobacteria bacterium]|nr:anthranilate synthase component I [Deltaproteobacteria bacterium]
MSILNFKQFSAAAKKGNLVTLVQDLPSDLHTPVSVLLQFQNEKDCFLFESLEGGEKWGRYCFLGFSPRLLLTSVQDQWTLIARKDLRQKNLNGKGDPLEIIKQQLSQYHLVADPRLPKLCGGAVGFLSYDLARLYEKLPDAKTKASVFADCYFGIYDQMIIFDHLRHQLFLVLNVFVDPSTPLKKLYAKALQQLKEMQTRVQKPLSIKNKKALSVKKINWKTLMEDKKFSKAVLQAKEYINAGDIFQVQISRQWTAKAKLDSVTLYRSLRALNPSPYLFYLKMGDSALIGSSPEIMVRLEDRKATLRPIAGTRRRGHNPADDVYMEEDLMKDPKERAEHIMLVDLGRNDLGRVCTAGTVKVTELMEVERYSHVMHLVSNVEGELAAGQDAFDLIRASFPAGTLTGAPKIRAMEIIEELEPIRRGPYGGCVGYIDFSGNSDLAITIRTIAQHKDQLYIQSAGGVVYDSTPELELKETENKSRAVKLAVERVARGEI